MKEEIVFNEINVTESQVIDFEAHPVWMEFKSTVEERLQRCEDILGASSDMNEILRNQGEKLSLQFFLILPELMKRDIEIEAQKEAQKQPDTEEE